MSTGIAEQQETKPSTDLKPVAAKPTPLYLRLISFPVMLGFLIVTGVFASTIKFGLDPDVWWHIRVGETILQTHHWPTVDPYSFTAGGSPWIAYEWLGEVILAWFVKLGGLQGLEVFQIIVGGGILLALYVYGTLRSGNSKAGFVAAASLMIFATLSFSLRPQMLGYLFLIVTLIVLELFRQGKAKALWALPPLFLVWVNTHGSFIIGIGVVALHLIAGLKEFHFGGVEARVWTTDQRRKLELALLSSIAVLVITPYGSELAFYPFDIAFNQPLNVANILEWRPMPFDEPGGKIFLAIVLAYFVLQTTLRLAWSLQEYVLALGGIAMATLHVRFVLLFVPFFTPVLALILARWIPKYEERIDKYVLNAILMVAMVAGVIYFFPTRARLNERVAMSFPVKAVEYLRINPVQGNIYNTYGYGGYLIHSGQFKVFVDGRADVYERMGVLADYLKISRVKPNALIILRTNRVQACLIGKDDPLATLLAASPGWEKKYEDHISVLYLRKPGVPDQVAANSVAMTKVQGSE